jgi:type VI secretion system protein ImpK
MQGGKNLPDWIRSKKALAKAESIALYGAFATNLRAKAASRPLFAKLVSLLPEPTQGDRQEPCLVQGNRNKTSELTSEKRLSDVFMPMMAFMRGFEQTPVGSAEVLSDKLNLLIGIAQGEALNRGFTVEQFTEGLFPVVAWMDERISLLRHWENVHGWQAHLLQRRYFRTTVAGVKFYERLEELIPAELDERELYYLCLCVGFKGQFNDRPNAPELAAIRLEQYQLLQEAGWCETINEETVVFPFGYQPDDEQQIVHQAWWRKYMTPRWIAVIAGPPCVFLLMMVIFSMRLTSYIDAFWKPINL